MPRTQTGLLVSIIMLLASVGCAKATVASPPTQQVSSVKEASVTPVKTMQPLPTITPHPDPTSTPQPTLTPSPTTTPVATTTTFMTQPESQNRPIADAASTKRKAVVPILMYHYISVPPRNADRIRKDLSVAPRDFENELAYLEAYSYTAMSLNDLYTSLATGAPLPPKPVVITFDDGYRDAYVNAFPLLKKYHMTGTFFIISDFINNENPAYLTWNMVKEMSAAGMSIESHSRTHPDMRNRPNDFLVYQILGPIETITAYTGKRPHFFCYPSGQYDMAVIRVLKSADTWAAVTTQSGNSHTLADAMTWTRVRVHGSTTLPQFAELVKFP